MNDAVLKELIDTKALRALADRVSNSASLPGGVGLYALHEWETVTPATLIEILDALEAAQADAARYRELLSEVSCNFTRDDDLPDNLLPRIDAAMKDQTP